MDNAKQERTREPHSPDRGGARRRPASALLLAGTQSSSTHRVANRSVCETHDRLCAWGEEPGQSGCIPNRAMVEVPRLLPVKVSLDGAQ